MVEEIFYLSARRQRFAGADDKRDLLERWTGYYRESEPGRIFLALLPGGRVAGYLTGCANSREAARLYGDIPYYALFEDRFDAYPAHFHVNCHPEFRGRGIGTRLVGSFLEDCAAAGLPGVHLVTSVGARNVAFYERCGFTDALIRRWEDRDLLFLGQVL